MWLRLALAAMVVWLGVPVIAAAQTATITVNSVVVPASDPGHFNLQIDGVTKTTSPVGNNGSTGPVTVSAGSHSVSETGATGTNTALYTTSINCGTAGTATGSSTTITLAAGDNVTCTITNTNAGTATITVNKVVAPKTDPGRFTLLIDGVAKSSPVGNNGSTGPVTVSAGSHSVSETGATGLTNTALYTTTTTCTDGTTGARSTFITLAAGANVTCTITNTTIDVTVTKVFVPAGARASSCFAVTIDGTPRPLNTSLSTGPVTVGPFPSHTVGETCSGTPTTFADFDELVDCGGAGKGATGQTSTPISTPTPGTTVTCTITNTRHPRLTITKVLKPVEDSGRFDLRIDGTVVKSGAVDGDSVGPRILAAGQHTISETGSPATTTNPATNLADYVTSIDCGSGPVSATSITVTLANATDTTCTITNLGHPRLTIVKSLLPPGDPGRFDLGISNAATGAGIILASNVQDFKGTLIFVPPAMPGSYSISERASTFANPPTNIADYDTTIDCGSGPMTTTTDPGGLRRTTAQLSFNPGDSRTCTITNLGSPQVTLKKIVLPSDFGVFTLQIDGAAIPGTFGNGASVTRTVSPNTSHTIGEAGGFLLSLKYDTFIDCGQGVVGGTSTTVNLARGQTATCTITNLGPPRLTVTKVVVSPVADSGRFNLQIDGVTVFSNVSGSGGFFFLSPPVSPGTHTVGETAGTNTKLKTYSTDIVCDGLATNSITLHRGDDKVCTITNTNLLATCLADCADDRNECMALVGQPGALSGLKCANMFRGCQAGCRRSFQ